eukprot:3462555-Pyramimonas_sp.AAC.1
MLGAQVAGGRRVPVASSSSKTGKKLQPIRRKKSKAAPKGPPSAAHLEGGLGGWAQRGPSAPGVPENDSDASRRAKQ